MNKRIKELIEQAGFKTEAWLNLDGTPKATIYKEAIGGNNLEKFAELIVQECLDACSRANEIRHFVPPTQQQVVLSCMREIEKHFGVE